MTILERVEQDYKTAFKAGDRLRIDTLRLIKAEAQKVAIDKRKDTLSDQDVIPVLSKQSKQRNETIASAKQAGRQDIVDQATAELAILRTYLPKQLSSDELKQMVDAAVAEHGANQGLIMKTVMAKASGQADGKLVNQLVAERLKAGA